MTGVVVVRGFGDNIFGIILPQRFVFQIIFYPLYDGNSNQ